MTKLMVYRDEAGMWQLWGDPAFAVEAELVDGYRVGKLGGRLTVLGKSGDLGISADEAVRHRVIRIPATGTGPDPKE